MIKKILVPMVFCCWLIPAGFVQAASDTKSIVDFQQAGSAYRSEDFQKAIELYEGIMRTGRVSEAVFYNLANSYMKVNDLGRAILNYERARILMPRDADLKANYRYALSQMKEPQEFHLNSVQKVVLNYRDFFSPDELTIWIIISFFLTGAIFYASLFLKWGRKLSWTLMVFSCFFMVFNSIMLFWKMSYFTNLAVMVLETEAKFEPLNDATTHFRIQPGWKVKILKEEGDWNKINRLDGLIGWVKKDTLERI